MVKYQGMKSGLPVFVVGEFGAFEIFMQNECFAKPGFLLLETSKIDHIWIEYDHILQLTNHKSTRLRFWLIYKIYNAGIVEKETPLNHPLVFNFSKNKVNHM